MNMEPASEVGVTKKSRGFEWSKAPIQMRTLVIISARVVLEVVDCVHGPMCEGDWVGDVGA